MKHTTLLFFSLLILLLSGCQADKQKAAAVPGTAVPPSIPAMPEKKSPPVKNVRPEKKPVPVSAAAKTAVPGKKAAKRSASKRSVSLSGTSWVPDPSDRVFSNSAFAVPENSVLEFRNGNYAGQAGENRFYGQYEEKGKGLCRFSKGAAAPAKSSEPVRLFLDHWMKSLAAADRYVVERDSLRLYRGDRLQMKLKAKQKP